MKKGLLIIPSLLLIALAACQTGVPPTQIVMEVPVTVEVTRVVTAVSQTGPLPFDTPSPAPTSDPTTATPTISPTPDLFPEPEVGQVFVAQQQFENGQMFWVRPINQIWVLITTDDGTQTWQVYEDTFQEGEPEFDPELEAPSEDLEQPIRGFGKLWRENEQLQEQLGWALEPEVGYYANYEYHYGGRVEGDEYVQGPGYHLIENPERRIFRFNEGIWQWEVSEPEA